MLNLENIQKEFQEAIMKLKPETPTFFVSTKKISADERFDVYSQGYRLRLIECLEANFPVLAKYLGEDAFFELGLGYLYEYPSQNPSVRWFGHKFSEFIGETEKYGDNHFLIELAKFEWTITLVFDGPDFPSLSFSDLSQISPENWSDLVFSFHPSLYRLELNWNSARIWEAGLHEKKLPKPKKLTSPQSWMLWRKNLEVSLSLLEAQEAKILDLALRGETWSTLCEALLENMSEEEIPNYIAPLFQKWVLQGLIVDADSARG